VQIPMEVSTVRMHPVKWVLLVDARHGRLLGCVLTDKGRCHVEEDDCIDWAPPARQRGSKNS